MIPKLTSPKDSSNFVESDSNSINESHELKLLSAKQVRQKMEENAQNLQNRVMLLENERLKMLKKIQQVKRRASEIIKTRQRVQSDEALRKELEQKRQVELEIRQNKIQEMKALTEVRLTSSKSNSRMSTLTSAQMTKQTMQVRSIGFEGPVPNPQARNGEGQ
jgi:hypothetical protein